MISKLKQQIHESVAVIRTKTSLKPRVGIILGTGLGQLANEVSVECSIDYDDIPNMPVSTVESHHGQLIFGTLSGQSVVVMKGRFHYYEGYTMKQITHGVRIMKELGADTLIVSNACGALNHDFRRSDVMLITDHINLLGDNPLIGENDPTLGVRFPDMSEPYTASLLELARTCANDLNLKIQNGVYVAVSGPNLETRAEYRFLRGIGADVVGMSTIPEVIAAVHASMNVLGISVITDECFPDTLQPVEIKEILEAAAVAEPVMSALVKEVLRRM